MKQVCLKCVFNVYQETELKDDDLRLVQAARNAVKSAYVPYSHFRVGAAALLGNGEIICGSNQENAAYPSGTCAERTALFYAGARYPGVPVKALAVAAFKKGEFLSEPIPPCGACRQVILETEKQAGRPLHILLYGTAGTYVTEGIANLLPLNFTSENMK